MDFIGTCKSLENRKWKWLDVPMFQQLLKIPFKMGPFWIVGLYKHVLLIALAGHLAPITCTIQWDGNELIKFN